MDYYIFDIEFLLYCHKHPLDTTDNRVEQKFTIYQLHLFSLASNNVNRMTSASSLFMLQSLPIATSDITQQDHSVLQITPRDQNFAQVTQFKSDYYSLQRLFSDCNKCS